jgi:hypothetical protein
MRVDRLGGAGLAGALFEEDGYQRTWWVIRRCAGCWRTLAG